jgi:hypothetical protein
MTENPTRAEFHAAIRVERRSLAEIVDTFTPEQWSASSACSGWTIGETVNHLLVGDGGTWRAAEALFRIRSPYRWVADRQRELAKRGPSVAAEQLRDNRLPITARLPGRFGPRDILRPLGLVRSRSPELQTAIASLRTVARWQFRKVKAGGTLAVTVSTGGAFTVISKFSMPRIIPGLEENSDARITGDIVDLMTFLTGRASNVTVEGDGPLADALRSEMPTV